MIKNCGIWTRVMSLGRDRYIRETNNDDLGHVYRSVDSCARNESSYFVLYPSVSLSGSLSAFLASENDVLLVRARWRANGRWASRVIMLRDSCHSVFCPFSELHNGEKFCFSFVWQPVAITSALRIQYGDVRRVLRKMARTATN